MNKQKLQTLKGFRDFLPADAKKRQFTIETIKQTFELFGFEPLETPALEYQEVLLGKYGEEADKLVYTFKDKGRREVALRYDQTVPTARVLATYQQRLAMPFRRYQTQPVWRAERPQKGRFREILQCDADIYGSASPLADTEIISLANSVFKNLGFQNFSIFINDRKILFELMNYSSIPENLHLQVISEIDKLDRKDKEEVTIELTNLGLSQKTINHLFQHLETSKPTENIEKITEYAKLMGVEKDKLKFQARLARGLDYYTSTIFEIKIDEYKGGSVAGGGRYDNLIEKLSGNSIPAVGIAFGIDRIIEAMQEIKLFSQEEKRLGSLITIFNPELIPRSLRVARILRQAKIPCEIFVDQTKDLKKQLKYADKKGIKWLIVIGPDEAKNASVILKDLETGYQESIKLNDLIRYLLKR
ncbi:histidine--tRNA ligase [Candidatus Woesebacteria bacterium RIFCSPHIGHO2_01_FULL_38_10]|uniref:Histidine--tRNA ligase n=1 Tax=Candidatus Woesebacteria bacterium RIFCSPLOWO2_01_FULL_39_10b TaxID=1802517 RepID=A0A1F8BAS0_9BACT|nr:MAG: histidine--tRNA ligase [Candidatus Woesebacteria bacterium RIFCSPHIGHO2_01_FULL_38_10]OGM60485.1 MAG: histidine--tRNA ligase [Candidatus Woesebacteria bacterium RIFCSPLOWO2_01_FULL_39_10b]